MPSHHALWTPRRCLGVVRAIGHHTLPCCLKNHDCIIELPVECEVHCQFITCDYLFHNYQWVNWLKSISCTMPFARTVIGIFRCMISLAPYLLKHLCFVPKYVFRNVWHPGGNWMLTLDYKWQLQGVLICIFVLYFIYIFDVTLFFITCLITDYCFEPFIFIRSLIILRLSLINYFYYYFRTL